MNLPNKLTLGRIAATPLLVICLLSETVWGQYLALLLFIAAALTDYWDGRLAREHNLVTNFGKIMDPLADKLLMATMFICFVELGYAPAWMVILIIGREFAITGLRVLAAAEGRDISASRSGKHKTISQIVAVLIILVVNVIVSSLRAWAPPWEYALMSLGWLGQVMLYLAYYLPYAGMFVAAVLSLYSGLDYLLKNRELFQDPPA
ncbi:MAG: CDP-diacylglycerol--glycerol-3-phosphate 3-phosphatidyltransferase [Candidatus Firestonebacteria bacterium]|nr:CDP-diacylglycerol--glycerol-3-phosphate 3-phosphatidyltransferase [Candidatus Firestonebacteria bacterium]